MASSPFEGHRSPGGSGSARAGPFPYHQSSEPGGGSGAARREHTFTGAKQGRGARLKHMRWPLLRRGSRVRGRAREKLNALLASKLSTARAWDLKRDLLLFLALP